VKLSPESSAMILDIVAKRRVERQQNQDSQQCDRLKEQETDAKSSEQHQPESEKRSRTKKKADRANPTDSED
jgi:hypothetical protein